MTNRERFRAALAFEPVDRLCHVEWGFWEETYARWQGEGLPGRVVYPAFENLSDGEDLFEHLGAIRFGYLLPSQYFLTQFTCKVLEEDEHFRLERNERGVLVRIGEDFPGLQILGGIDKTEIAKGRQAIDAELERVLPVMARRGGYCAALDHWVPPQIGLEDYRYFVEKVRRCRRGSPAGGFRPASGPRG